ncbi:MAG: hypothetical protein ABI866_02135 [Dokdonella sp.]
MRRKNMRFVITGSVLIAAAVLFFLFFLSIAAKSNDPAAMMRTVGTVSGVVIGLGLFLLISGWIGKNV